MKTAAVGIGLWMALGLGPVARGEDPPPSKVIDLWPAEAPGEKGPIAPESVDFQGVKRVGNVSKPTLTVFRPAPEKDCGTSVVICPGGGYSILASDHEGDQVARWLNSIGVTGIVLKYRVPRRAGTPESDPPPQALMDAQRAVSLVRDRATELGIDPARVGILGFSAGGHLAAWASTNPDRRAYEPVDAADKASCRPDFAVLIYPAYLAPKGTEALAPEIRVDAGSPPTFFAHASDDPVTVESSVRMYLALKRAGVPAEMHLYAAGGHGFGINPGARPVAAWPRRVEDWMRGRGLLKPAGKP